MEISSLQKTVSSWYDANSKDKSCLLPQNLESNVFLQLFEQASLYFGSDKCDYEAFRTVVGLLMAKEAHTEFFATKQQIQESTQAYILNLILVHFVKSKIIICNPLPSVDDVLQMTKYREITLSEEGKVSLKKNPENLQKLLRVLKNYEN